jgi:hypothetical protein
VPPTVPMASALVRCSRSARLIVPPVSTLSATLVSSSIQ